ncbi:flagellar motor switch protein FliM [Halalkalibacillus sediminis]|uniref:Flagellar motor switch protein FliM n=1 Tax=Halalkalibacillus sediminis TaxID=2018042 RepID=A0A2I0QWE8_9BACI|nr:flagellar motor switch protein FliM [Halalkalibacillus sediminis]PKR78629.1 flagellar motor switch protein FliM [Halalkalibacillus sediminis]
MSEDVLSQNEIDALLSAISSGEMDAEELKQEEVEQKVRDYDFKRALRFSKDQIRGLTRIHENFARLLTSFFSAQLRSYVTISVASVDQVPFEEFVRSIPKRTILNIFSLAPLEGRLLFEVNPNVAYAMLDRTLGGRGASMNKVENLTEIETKIMSRTFERAMESLEEAWGSMVEVDAILEEFEVNPQFIQMVSPNETVVVISLNTTIGESSGMINICIPHMLLEPIISKLSVHYWMQNESSKAKPEDYHNLTKNLNHVNVDSKAVLGETSISIEEFLNLGLDDVISLDQKIDDPLKLYVNDEPKFHVQPGKKRNKLAVQILDEIRGEDDE